MSDDKAVGEEVAYYDSDGYRCQTDKESDRKFVLKSDYYKLKASLSAAREGALEEVERALVEGCEMCGGNGYTVIQVTGYGHACGGDEKLCQKMCPVPVPEQSQEQCGYCGPISQAIRALKPGGKS